MKVRNGFVSNSSSSSFIIDGDKYTCADVAIDMISDWLEHQKEYDWIDSDEYEKLKKLYTDRLNNLEDKNVGIFIQDSDDVEIERVGNRIYVDASNHVEWNIESLWDEYKDDEYYETERHTKWYFPQVDNKYIEEFASDKYAARYGKTWLYRCENPKCDHPMRFLVKDNQVFCPNCMHDPNGNKVSFRKEKLERLLDGEKN